MYGTHLYALIFGSGSLADSQSARKKQLMVQPEIQPQVALKMVHTMLKAAQHQTFETMEQLLSSYCQYSFRDYTKI